MMKNIMLVVSGMMIAFVICLGIGTAELKEYETRMTETIKQYEDIIDENEFTYIEKCNENSKLQISIGELEEEVWKILNNEEYEITIHHEGETHTYSYTKDGLFGNKKHIVTY